MRISDWSSDVCSSDLEGGRRKGADLLCGVLAGEVPLAIQTHRESDIRQAAASAGDFGIRVIIVGAAEARRAADSLAAAKEHGRGSCRERACQDVVFPGAAV